MILFNFVSKENSSPPVKKTQKLRIILLKMGDIAAHFKFHSANDSCPDSRFCRLSIHRNFSFSAYFGKFVGEYVQCLETHTHSWRNIASMIGSVSVNKIVCDTGSCVDNPAHRVQASASLLRPQLLNGPCPVFEAFYIN